MIALRKRIKREKRTYGFVWFVFLIIIAVFSRMLEYSMFARQITSVCWFFTWFYGMLLLTEKINFRLEQKRAKRDPDIPEKHPGAKKILPIVYLVVQIAVMLLFLLNQFTGTVSTMVYYDENRASFQIFMTGLTSVICFALAAFISHKEKRKASETASGLIRCIGVIAGLIAVFLILNSVLGISGLTVLSWVIRIYCAAVAVAITAGLVLSAVKREILTDFNYPLPFDFIRRSRGQKLADVLEEYTGLSVKSLWSIKYAAEILPVVLLGLVAVLFVSTCVYKVEPYEQAVLYHFGEIKNGQTVSPGIHFKAPWPIDKIQLYDVQRVRELSVGFEESYSTDNLWTQAHSGEEYKLLLGNGNELVSINMKLTYVISDLYSYVTTFSDPASVLSARAYEAVMNKTINTDLDTLLSVDRYSFSGDILKLLNGYCEEVSLGIRVNEVVLESIHPPIDIADVYQSVVSATVQKTTLKTNAEASAAEKIADAERDANTEILAAKTDQTERIADAEYEMDVFLAAVEQYREHPDAVTLAKYTDTFQTVVKNKKVYVFIGEIDMERFIINRAIGDTTVINEIVPSESSGTEPEISEDVTQ